MKYRPFRNTLILLSLASCISCTATKVEQQDLVIPEALLSVPERPQRPEYPSTAWQWHPLYTTSLEAYADDLRTTLDDLVWWLTDGNQSTKTK